MPTFGNGGHKWSCNWGFLQYTQRAVAWAHRWMRSANYFRTLLLKLRNIFRSFKLWSLPFDRYERAKSLRTHESSRIDLRLTWMPAFLSNRVSVLNWFRSILRSNRCSVILFATQSDKIYKITRFYAFKCAVYTISKTFFFKNSEFEDKNACKLFFFKKKTFLKS